MSFVIFGPPGAGKGTYASILASRLRIAKISTGDMIREEIKRDMDLGKKIVDFVNKGKLVPDDIVIEIVKEAINKSSRKNGFILDGYPRTIEQARALDSIGKIDAVIQLGVPEQVIIARLSSRRICKKCGAVYNLRFLKPKKEGACDACGTDLYQREDDKPEVIRARLRVYESQTRPLIDYYKDKAEFINIECNSVDIPPETIVRRILRELQEKNLIG
ncbi:MAG: adenylate kinase [Candidatus Bathyarchaeota archaeon]|nr:MAG: adenylate kinase [Candidatus Bathyarchaeota archaeon]